MHPLIRASVFFLAVCPAAAANAADNIFDSYCHTAHGSQSSPAPWIIDDDVNDRMNPGFANVNMTIDNVDMENAVDLALQDQFRFSRAIGKARVLYGFGECSIDSSDGRPCIEAVSDVEDPDDCGDPADAFAAEASCGLGGCWVKICQDDPPAPAPPTWPGAWATNVFARVLAHEIGHTYGLNHPDAADAADTPCTGEFNSPAGFCASTDGCDGELMCSAAGCSTSQFFTLGDARGLRNGYGATPSRQTYYGRDALSGGTGLGNPARKLNGFGAANGSAYYAPRISCSQAFPNSVDCAAVFQQANASATNVRVVKLDGQTGAASWTTETIVGSVANTFSTFAPDITVNQVGSVAYVVTTDDRHRVTIHRVPMSGGTVTQMPLFTVGNTAIAAALPPRVEFADGRLLVLVARHTPVGSEIFGAPTWTLINVSADLSDASLVFMSPFGGSSVVLTSATYSSTHALASEYDFACRATTLNGNSIAQCTIVGQFFHDDADIRLSRMRSIRFQFSDSPLAATLLDAQWAVSDLGTNGILGVAVTPAGTLYVASSVMITTGTGTSNSRVTRHSNETVAGAAAETTSHRGDAVACSSQTGIGEAFSAASMHGGYSIAWAGTTGDLESISWGAGDDGNTNCY